MRVASTANASSLYWVTLTPRVEATFSLFRTATMARPALVLDTRQSILKAR